MVKKEKQKITDGIRSCWYGGNVNTERFSNGQGMLAYDNKDVFKGVFTNGVLDREVFSEMRIILQLEVKLDFTL